jgi:hypothetical protein
MFCQCVASAAGAVFGKRPAVPILQVSIAELNSILIGPTMSIGPTTYSSITSTVKVATVTLFGATLH